MKTPRADLLVGAVATAVGLAAIAWTVPGPAQPSDNVLLALSRVSATETPATIVGLLRRAPAEDRGATAQRIPAALVALQRQGVLPYAVSQAVGAQPELAPSLAAAVAATCPEQLLPAVKAAVLAAPARAEAIVAAVCRQSPAAFAETAVLAGRHSPDHSRQILEAVSTSVPVLQPLLRAARTAVGSDTDLNLVMTHVVQSLALDARAELRDLRRQNVTRLLASATATSPDASSDLLPADPQQIVREAPRAAQARITAAEKTVDQAAAASVGSAAPSATSLSSLYLTRFNPQAGPPFTPPPSNRTIIGIGDTVVVPPGGRDYSAP